MAIVRMTLEQAKSVTTQDELARLKNMADDKIDYSDIPPLSDEQIAKFKPTKTQVTIRLDSDVLAWLKKMAKAIRHEPMSY